MATWKVLDKQYVLKSPWLNVRKDHVLLPNGTELDDFYVLEYRHWVCIIAVTTEGKYLIEKQYRHGINQECYELCAGIVEKDEDPLVAAKRELLEETGCTCSEYIYLGEMLPTPAYNSEITYMYLAKGLTFTSQSLDPDEFLDVERIPLSEAVAQVMDGTIRDGKTQIAILKAARMLGI
jgi:ADP-ribose pyrophosphatase